MDTIIRFVSSGFPATDNNVENVIMPTGCVSGVADALRRYGLPTKDLEDLHSARVLELQLFQTGNSEIQWKRQDGDNMECPPSQTKT